VDTLDLIVIGGGINGAALAEVTAAAGYRVALFEQNDFGSGVTSRSTRLIHGGLRYLEHGQVGLVRESLREREALLRDYPQLVRPLPFLIPAYRDDSRSRWWVRIGLEAYDWIGRSRLVERHRQLSAAETLRVEPGLASQGLRGGFVYYDCQIVYPERLALRMALNAEACGATVRNHTEVTGFLGEPQLVTGVRLRGGEELGARLVVNAAGPWADRVRGLLAGGKGRPLLSLLNGAHIVTGAFPGAPSHAIYHEASSDHRPFFVIPWRGLWLIGTTETPFDGDPALVRPTAAEIEYLLRETNLLFPQARLTRAAVLYSYAGPRPLLHSSAQTQAMSREHTIYDHEAEEGIAGVLTLVGGKLTTARAFARQALESIAAKLGPAPGPPAHPRPVPPDGDGSLGGAVTYAVRHEKARSLADILLRRTGLAFEPDRGFGVVPEIARLAAPLLGWDEAATGRALAAYRAELDQVLFREQP
jgi:glycerol-3-phosphate dehydrogenase